MILLIDNYDSFSYNLYQLIGQVNDDIEVYRNDKITPDEIEDLNPEAIILSPGPGRPEDAGICVDTVKKFHDKIPILGVCLGHQAICETFGAEVTYAPKLMHGKQSEVKLDDTCKIFKGIGERAKVARYHSLIAKKDTIPDELTVTAVTDDGEVMAVKHRDYEIYSVQFHPESIMTPDGMKMLKNFFE